MEKRYVMVEVGGEDCILQGCSHTGYTRCGKRKEECFAHAPDTSCTKGQTLPEMAENANRKLQDAIKNANALSAHNISIMLEFSKDSVNVVLSTLIPQEEK